MKLTDHVRSGDALGLLAALQGGGDPNFVDSTGTPLVILAVREHQMPILALLANHGADIDKRDRASWTAVMEAAYRGDADTLDLLAAHGADFSLTDRDGNDAGWLATRRCFFSIADQIEAYAASQQRRADMGARCARLTRGLHMPCAQTEPAGGNRGGSHGV